MRDNGMAPFVAGWGFNRGQAIIDKGWLPLVAALAGAMGLGMGLAIRDPLTILLGVAAIGLNVWMLLRVARKEGHIHVHHSPAVRMFNQGPSEQCWVIATLEEAEAHGLEHFGTGYDHAKTGTEANESTSGEEGLGGADQRADRPRAEGMDRELPPR